jgi:hypothetical protein
VICIHAFFASLWLACEIAYLYVYVLWLLSERKHSKSPDGGETDSSVSVRSPDNEDRGKDERYLSSDEKNGHEDQVSLNYAIHLIVMITCN